MRLLKRITPGPVVSWAKSWFLLCSMLLLSACIDDKDTSADNPLNSASTKIRILVSANPVFLSKIGSQLQLTAMLLDSNGVASSEQPAFEWVSETENVVKIDQEGLMTAIALGQAVVRVSGAGESQAISVEVSDELITVNGKVSYEDKEYGSGGFNSRQNYYKAVRFAKVDLIAENGVGVLQTTFTDAEGNFAFTGVLNSQKSISVYAVTDETMGLKLRVEDRSSALYSVNKAIDLSKLDNFVVTIAKSSQAAGAFNILDVFVSSAQFTLANSEATSVELAAFWQPNNDDGTYYCTGFDASYCLQGAGVYVFNSVKGDTDEFDDDILYHEFAHYLLDALSRDDSLGGCHLLSSRDLDLRLAWSEGFGDFLPSAIKSWLSHPAREHLLSTAESLPVTAYVDTYGSTAQIYIDMATMSQSRYSSAANEMAVAKILWSLSERFGMPAVVKVLTDYLPGIGNTSVNLESFWDGWLVEHNPDEGGLKILEAIYNERLVYYQADNFESDDQADELRIAVPGKKETHYLYSTVLAADQDLVAFEVQAGKQYTLKTSGLTSGADTYISVLNSAKNPLTINGLAIENDDASPNAYYGYDSVCGSYRVKNNSTALASKVVFTAQTTGTYYAKISTTIDGEPYLSAGRYGTYDFKVSQN